MVKEHLNRSETKSRLYGTRAEWWCSSSCQEVTVTGWGWTLLKTIIHFPNWPLGKLFLAEKKLFNQSAHRRLFSEAVVSWRVYFWSVFCGAYIGQGNMIQCLFSSALFRSGSAFVSSERPSLLAAKSSLWRALSLKQAGLSCALTLQSYESVYRSLLIRQ